ncbi:hypothetical protein AYI68_g7700 [Smittium mucronatum]|uniref:DUF4139 domain-containing protein n=1 Tax=Smittium mucronatum TaxID=133383 RepID=A0A1R0GMZ7_9FUNG|nr:hypothetical protein AYI68_g7700 [Smittium mucronatum]
MERYNNGPDLTAFEFGAKTLEKSDLESIGSSDHQYSFSDEFMNIVTVNAKKSQIDQVSLYLNHALVSKLLKDINLVPGVNKVVIEHLPPVIIVDKFRIISPPDISILDTKIKVVPLDIIKSVSGSGPIDLSDDPDEDSASHSLNEKLRQAEIGLVMLERKQRMLDATFIPSAETGGEKSFVGNPAFVLQAMQEPSATDQFERILQYYADMSADIDQKITKQNKLITKLKHLIKEYDGNHSCSYFVRNNCTVVTFLVYCNNVKNIDIGLVYENAKWTPVYDIRVDKLEKKLSVFYGGDISQSTGEIWENTKIELVTSRGLRDMYRFPTIDRKNVYCVPANQKHQYLQVEKIKVGENSHSSSRQSVPFPTRTIETDTHEDLVLEIPDFNKININRSLNPGDDYSHVDSNDDDGANQTFSLGDNNTVLSDGRHHRVEAKNNSSLTFIPGNFQVYVDNEYVATGKLPVSPHPTLPLF